MMRVCHLNTCPWALATQDPELRKRFGGQPEARDKFHAHGGEEVRELMAQLGFRQMNRMIGRVDRLEVKKAVDHWKANGLDFTKILYQPEVSTDVGRFCQIPQDHGLDKALDNTVLLKLCGRPSSAQEKVVATLPIRNVNRVVGTIVGSEITRRWVSTGFPKILSRLISPAARPKLRRVHAQRHDLLSGRRCERLRRQRLVGRPKSLFTHPDAPTFVPEENIIVGNVALYGATSGEAYIRGMAGERFAVRNSGGPCGGRVRGRSRLRIHDRRARGDTWPGGTQFRGGDVGALLYVLDEVGDFPSRCNLQMVGWKSSKTPTRSRCFGR